MKNHEHYIKRSLQIAKNALGTARPNPMVGAVIVHDNTIIGEGYTNPFGGPHAEVNAINSIEDKNKLSQSTIYVTLEPCSHYGKTPPCSDLIIKHKIPNVVIGCVDDNPEVSGRGISKLKAAGCNVIVGILEKECKNHHKRFYTFHNKKRPYIILKWAQSTDGFIAPTKKDEKKPIWITNKYSRQLVHKWRSEEQAILVGTNTVIEDNPSLTVRDWTGQNPIRIITDKSKSLGDNYSIFNSEAKTINLTGLEINFEDPIACQICDNLYKHQINSVIIEGGTKTIKAFIKEKLWDEARIFIGNKNFGDGVNAPDIKGKQISETKILDDTLKIIIND